MYDILNTAASVATTVAIAAAVISLRQNHRQRLRHFEQTYVDRYWNLMEDLSLGAMKGDVESLTDNDRRRIRSYIILCEDELQLRREGWVSDVTWGLWAPAIQEQLSREPFASVWAETLADADENPNGFQYQYVSMLLSHPVNAVADPKRRGQVQKRYKMNRHQPVAHIEPTCALCDPLQMGGLARTIRGLKGVGGV